jgi:hypothetical protein
MKLTTLGLLVLAALSAAQDTQKFTGRITDSMCDDGNHSRMQMGPTDAECAAACVDAHGAIYVLSSGKDVYSLSDQRTSAGFAGQQVTVTGALDPKTKAIRVESIVAATSRPGSP